MSAARRALSGWRKIAAALWDAPNDPQIFGVVDVEASAVLDFVRSARAAGHHVTPTHLVGRALARALVAVPALNVRLVGGCAVPRGAVDVFFITSVGAGHDLSGVKIEGADVKGAVKLGEELDRRSRAMKAGHDLDLARAKQIMQKLPAPLLRLALRGTAWLAMDHAVALPWLGIGASPFGSAMLSSVGMLGIPMGFTPLVWLYRVPIILVMGEIEDRPVAVAGRVEIRPILPITATIDHRYVDGAEIAEALRVFREYLAAPSSFEPGLAEGVASP